MHLMAHPITRVAQISLVQAIFEIQRDWKAAHAALAKNSLKASLKHLYESYMARIWPVYALVTCQI